MINRKEGKREVKREKERERENGRKGKRRKRRDIEKKRKRKEKERDLKNIWKPSAMGLPCPEHQLKSILTCLIIDVLFLSSEDSEASTCRKQDKVRSNQNVFHLFFILSILFF